MSAKWLIILGVFFGAISVSLILIAPDIAVAGGVLAFASGIHAGHGLGLIEARRKAHALNRRKP